MTTTTDSANVDPGDLHAARTTLTTLVALNPSVLVRLFHEYGEAMIEEEDRRVYNYLRILADIAFRAAQAAQMNDDLR